MSLSFDYAQLTAITIASYSKEGAITRGAASRFAAPFSPSLRSTPLADRSAIRDIPL